MLRNLINFSFKNSRISASVFILISSSAALIFAYISQYFFHHQPCELCIYQRLPYVVLIFLSLTSLLLEKKLSQKILAKFQKIFLALFLALIFSEIILAFYHVGVEQKIFSGLSGCSSTNENFSSLAELEQIIKNAPAVKCDTPSFIFLNLSMAAWNLIYSFLIGLFLLVSALKNRH